MALGEGAPTGVSVDVWPHPLTSEGQHDAVAPAGVTLGQAVRDAGLGSRPVRAWIDGREVDAEIMDGRALAEGEIVTLRADVRGGGGGGGNKVLRTILSIAVLAAAVFVPPLLGFAAGTVGGALASAGVLVAGNLLVNALVPPEIPRLDGPGSDRSTPVYSLAGGANRARLYAPLLCVLGSHRVFPDLAAAEYQTFEDGEQFLHQIFDFGVGDIDVTDLKSGAQALSGFDGVTEYRALGGGQITRIAGNVDTIAGAQLEDTNAVSRTAPACTSFQVDLVARVFSISDKGETEENSVSVEISWSAPGQAGGSVTRTIGTQSQAKDGETVFVQDQRRMTVTQELPALADWQVSVRRTTAPSDDDRTYDDVAFTALRAFQPDTGDYAGRNRIGVRFKASAQLQGRLDRISGTVHQKVPDLVGGSWSAPRRTSNPASVFRWIALGVREGGAPWMGLHLAASRLDDAQMRAWHAWCAAEGLACNFVVDRERTVDDLLRLVARCGRASPTWQSGRLGVVFDRAGQAPTALVTPGNVVQGSFGVEWASAAVAEEIAVRYVEPMLDWQWNTVRKTVPGVSGTPASTVTQTLEGVTSAAQAAAEAGLLAARHAYQRRRLTWEMSAEGLAIRRGQVLNVTHSLIDGGVTGRLRGGGTDQVQLDREVTLTGDDWIALRLHDGTVHTSRVTRPQGVAGDTDRLALVSPLRLPAADPERPALDVLWRLYDSAEPPLRAKVISTEPLSDRAVRMVAIDEDPRYYAGKNAAPDSVGGVDRGRPRVVWISVTRRQVQTGSGSLTEMEAVLTVAGAWEGAEIRVGRGTAESVRTVAQLRGDDLSARWIEEPKGEITVTAIPIEGGGQHLAGAKSVDYDFTPLYDIAPLTDFRVVALADGTRQFSWTPPADFDLAGIVIRYAADPDGDDDDDDIAWGAMTPLHKGVLTASPWETSEPAPGNWQFAARALSTSGELSEIVRVTETLGEGRQAFGQLTQREFIFTASATADLAAARLPNNAWTYDNPGTAGGQQWHDAAPSLTEDEPFLLQTSRATPADAARGDEIADEWLSPVVIGHYGQIGEDGVAGATGDDGAGIEFIFAKTSSSTPPAAPSNAWGFDAPGINAYITAGREALFSRGGSTVAAGSQPDDAWAPGAGGTRGGRTWTPTVPSGSGTLWKAERARQAGASWAAPAQLSINGSASTVWFDAAPILAVGEYLWMAQRRTDGFPQVGQAVTAQWTSVRSLSRVAQDGADSTVPGPRGPQGPQGPQGPAGRDATLADTTKYYDAVRQTGGRITRTGGNFHWGPLVADIRGVEEPQTDGTRLWLQWRYGWRWESDSGNTNTTETGPWPT